MPLICISINSPRVLRRRPLRLGRDRLDLERRARQFRRLGLHRRIDAHAGQSAPDHPAGKG